MHIHTTHHHSPLGTWTHSECRPKRLAGLVDMLWQFEGQTALPRERSFGKAYVEIILQLGPRFHEVLADGTRGRAFPTACVGGATTMPSVIEAPAEPCCIVGIRLHAHAASQLLSAPLPLLVNDTIDLCDATRHDSHVGHSNNLAAACYAQSSVAERFKLICVWLQRQLQSAPQCDPSIAWAARQLKAGTASPSIATVQQQTGHTRAQFVTRFRNQVGLAPKQYARILRFQCALSFMRDGQSLSNSALSAGYFDQAHMHRDFAEFARLTPMAFMTANRFPNSASLSEL